MNNIMPGEGIENTHEIPGWDRPKWAIRGVKDRDELTRTCEASTDVRMPQPPAQIEPALAVGYHR